MIRKLESAGLGFFIKTTDTQERIGECSLGSIFASIKNVQNIVGTAKMKKGGEKGRDSSMRVQYTTLLHTSFSTGKYEFL